MSVFFILLSVISCLCSHSAMFPLVKGSTTQMSLEPFVTFPASDTDNIMLGFGWFKNGFALEDATTTCTFDSVYPVSGTVNLNDGTLFLEQDLFFKNITNLQGLGTIIGNNHMLEFGSSIKDIPANAKIFEDVQLFFYSDLVITNTIIFKGNCTLYGYDNTIFLKEGGHIVVDKNSTLSLKSMTLEGVSGNNIRCVDDSGKLLLDSMRWVQEGDFSFLNGSMQVVDEVSFFGPHTFWYDTVQTCTISSHARWHISEGMTLKVGRKTPEGAEPLYFEDSSAVLWLSYCNMRITSNGMQLMRGMVMFDHDVTIDIDSTSTANGVVIGNGDPAEDIIFQCNAGASVKHASGHVVFNSGSPHFLRSAARKNARFIRDVGSTIFVMRDVVLPAFVVELTSNFVSPLIAADGVRIDYDDTSVILPDAEFDITCNQVSAFVYHLEGNDSIFFTKGVFPLYLMVSGIDNVIRGNGSMLGQITLTSSSAALTCGLNGNVGNTVVMNGGSLILSGNLTLDPNGSIVGPGQVDLNACILRLPSEEEVVVTTPIEFSGQGGRIELNGQLTLKSTWTIEGTIEIDGRGNIFQLGDDGVLYLKENARLILKNMKLKGIRDGSLACADDTCNVELNNLDWIQSSNYSFSHGSLKIANHVRFIGDCEFLYASGYTCTIASESEWHITESMRVSMGKKSFDASQPLYFVDQTSVMRASNCTLNVTGFGFTFVRGRVIYEQDVAIDIVGTQTHTGLIVGTGDSVDDAIFQYNAGSNVTLKSGYFTYNNSAPDKVIAMSRNAKLTRLLGSMVYIARDICFPAMTLEIASSMVPPMLLSPNAILQYNNSKIILPTVEFEITSNRYDLFTYFLDGFDELFLTKGIFPLNIRVTNAGNTLLGNGSVIGTITFEEDNDAQLICGFSGSIAKDVVMNNGTIILSRDLNLASAATLRGPGTINLGGYTISFGPKKAEWNYPLCWIGDSASVSLHADVELKSTWTIQGECEINGHGNMLELGELGEIIVADNAVLTLRDVRVSGVADENIRCLGNGSVVRLNNMIMMYDDHFTFSTGSISFSNQVDFLGSSSFVYDSSQTCTIGKKATWHVGPNMTLRMGKKTPTSCEPLVFDCDNSYLDLDNCTFAITKNGMQAAHGHVIFKRDVTVDIDSNDWQNGLIMGDGVTTRPMSLELVPGATIHFTRGHLTFNSLFSDAIKSRSKTSKIVRSEQSFFNIMQNTVLSNITIDASPYSTLVLPVGKNLMYDNCAIVLSIGTFDIIGTRYDSFTNLLSGEQSIFLTKGTQAMYTAVMGQNNWIQGNGNVSGGVVLLNSSAELKYDVNGFMLNAITLNGGTLQLQHNMNIVQDKVIQGPGVVDLQSHSLNMVFKNTVWPGPLTFKGAGGVVRIHESLTLTDTWIIDGDCTIDGHGEMLDLGDTGKILVNPGAKLTLKDVIIENASGTNICCADDTGIIVFDGALWCQNADFMFDTGSLVFKASVPMYGNFSFIYTSTMPIIIRPEANVQFNEGLVFKYMPSNDAQDLIVMENAISTITLNSSTLHVGLGGLTLSGGKLHIAGDSCLCADFVIDYDAIIQSVGITLGDGENDCACEIDSGAKLNIKQGVLHYNNIYSSSWKAMNSLSTLHMHLDTTLYIDEDLAFGEGRLLLSNAARMILADGKNMTGALFTVE